MTNTCPCRKPTGPDGYLCRACTRHLAQQVAHVPAWVDDLQLVGARLVRYTDPTQHSGDAKPLPFDERAAAPLRQLHDAIRNACHEVGAPEAVTSHRLGVQCAWLAKNIAWLRRHPDAPKHRLAIMAALTDAADVCDRPPDRWYAGRCELCQKDLYVRSNVATVKCSGCGASWDVDTRRDQLLDKLRDRLATGPDIARGLTSLQQPVTQEQLRRWRATKRLEVRRTTGGPGTGQPTTYWYRTGDVMDLLDEDEARASARRRKAE